MPKTQVEAPEETTPTNIVDTQSRTREPQAGPTPTVQSQRATLPPSNGGPSAARAADLLASPGGPGAAGRARMATVMQRRVGNARLGRMVEDANAPGTSVMEEPLAEAQAPAETRTTQPLRTTPDTQVETPTAEETSPPTTTGPEAEPAVITPPIAAQATEEGRGQEPAEPMTETAETGAAATVETAGEQTRVTEEATAAEPEETTTSETEETAPPSAAEPSSAPAAEPTVAAAPETPAAREQGGEERTDETSEADRTGEETEEEFPEPPNPREAVAPATGAVRRRAATQRQHPPAGDSVGAAQAAAIEQDTEQTRGAAAQTVRNLDETRDETEGIQRQQFKAQLRAAIREATPRPQTESEAQQVIKTGASEASNALRGELDTQRESAVGPMEEAAQTEAAPSDQPAPAEVELEPAQAGPPPEPVSAGSVVPEPLPPERLDYSSHSASTETLMAENDISQEQIEQSNEPAFQPAIEARSTAEAHEATVEPRYRVSEAEVRGQAEGQAQEALAQGLGAFHGAREQQMGQVAGQQTDTRSQDAAERRHITERIQTIKNNTQSDVEGILNSMEEEASRVFERGLEDAEEAYESAFEEAKGGVGTWLTTWGEDWDRHIEAALATARRRYLREVDSAIDDVAEVVEEKLSEARQRVADGRQEVKDFVEGLDESVKEFGEEALEAVSADFDAMEEQINERRDALVNSLVQQYKASYERMSAREEELRQANKSLWQRVYDATVGVVQKILEFKNMLLGVLSRAADVVGDIIDDPIGFLGNLIAGVKLGLDNFVARIGQHLQDALMDWLFGTLGEAGIEMPESLDLKGILSLVLQILGLTYANIRQRAVNILGEELVSRLEQVAEIFGILITEGPGGLWEYIKEQIGNLKAMVLDEIKSFVIQKIVIAGVKWVVGLLNPASAFVKACLAIYDVIKFFIERGSQILSLVNAIIDSLSSIVKGDLSVAAKLVEEALAKALPVVIGFLASLLGLGGISQKIKSIIEKIQRPINKAIDWVIQKAVKMVKAAGKLLGFGKEEPQAEEEGPETDDPEHDAKVQAGLAAIDKEEQRYLEEGEITREEAEQVATNVRREHPVFTSITVVDGGDTWDYEYATSPANTKEGEEKEEGEVGDLRQRAIQLKSAVVGDAHPIAKQATVVAVGVTKNQHVYASMNSLARKVFKQALQRHLKKDERFAGTFGGDKHAEENLQEGVAKRGESLERVEVSNSICLDCEKQVIEAYGIATSTPFSGKRPAGRVRREREEQKERNLDLLEWMQKKQGK